ncbi:hypothetical protein EDP1_1968 [Pseudomonas putida S610]|nr:hypothetical protein EDP1_1968 [Pseudomonas putida S610]
MEDDGRGGSDVLPRPPVLLAAKLDSWSFAAAPTL